MWVASIVLAWGVVAFGFEGIADVAALPLFGLAMMVFGLLTMPAGNYMSRQMERAADRYATARRQSRSLPLGDGETCGPEPIRGRPPAWVRFLFYSHPPVSERIKEQP